MPNIEELLNRSRKELLDLSTRNRLLSIPKSRSARVVHVFDELSEEVFRLLVAEKKSMSFLPGKNTGPTDDELRLADTRSSDQDEAGLPQPEDGGATEGPARRHTDLRLQTTLTPEGLQRRLLALHRDARTMIEEQGVNILYLSLGQLKWFEVAHSDTPLYAPLILIPVALERRTASERFYVRWLEEDIQENLSLVAKLKGDFGIDLPEFTADEDFNPTRYFKAVTKAVREGTRKGWEVLPDAITLGFFSFAKFLMYRDLDPENWPDGARLLQHPLIAGLLVDGFPTSEPPFAEGAHLDELIPAARLDHVVNADSSQTVAIEMARQGRNLVIQGPPGTGKSQSITNVIAAAVLDGRKVLFVAEKLAALQVVKRRLEREGLGPACLELHSNKSNKRAVIEEIGRTWQLGRPTSGRLDAVVAQLERTRGSLNRHVALLHEQAGPRGLSPYIVVGRLVALEDCGRTTGELSFSGAEEWTSDDFENRRQLIVELATRVAEIGVPARHPWRGARRETVLRIDLPPLAARIRSLSSLLAELRATTPTLAGILEREIPATLAEVEEQLVFAESSTLVLSEREPWIGVGTNPIAKGSLSPLGARIGSLIARLGVLQQVADALAMAIEQPAPGSFSDIQKHVTIANKSTITLSSRPAWRGVGNSTIKKDDLDSQAATIRSLIQRIFATQETSGKLAGAIHQRVPRTLADIEEQRIIAGLVAVAPPLDCQAFTCETWDTHLDAIRSAVTNGRRYTELVSTVGSQVTESVWGEDFADVRAQLAVHGHSWLRFLRGDYRRSMTRLRRVMRTKLPKRLVERLALVDQLIAGQSALRALRTVDMHAKSAFGTVWRQEQTDWNRAEQILDWVARLREFGLGTSFRRMFVAVEDLPEVARLVEKMSSRLGAARSNAEQLFQELGVDCATVFSTTGLDGVALEMLTARLQTWGSDLESLSEWNKKVTQMVMQLAPCLVAARDEAGQVCKELALDHRKAFGASDLDAVLLDALAERCRSWRVSLESLEEWSKRVARAAEQLVLRFEAARDETGQVCKELSLDCGEAFGAASVDQVPLVTIVDRCQTWLTELDSLIDWSHYYRSMQRACELGLNSLAEQLRDGTLVSGNAADCFERVYYEQVLRWFIQRNPELAQFDGRRHDATIAEFRRLDCDRLKLAKHRAMTAHFQGMPPCSAGVGATGIVRAEMERKRGHRSIRRLLKEAGSVVQAIKPVFMMSPLSVAQFIEPGALEFDLLVIDEASQVQPVDALGSIARCKQIIVVGDSKQLPPTRFFARLTTDSDGEAEMEEEVMPAQAQEMESILGLCAARGLPQTMLGWHYRSRHHTLIAVSNHEFLRRSTFHCPEPMCYIAGTWIKVPSCGGRRV